MVPEPAPDGESDHVTLWFAAPDTEAESCQFAPTPIGQGRDIEAAQPEFRMLTVTGCCMNLVDDEPPQPASARRPTKTNTRHAIWQRKFCKGHLPEDFKLYRICKTLRCLEETRSV